MQRSHRNVTCSRLRAVGSCSSPLPNHTAQVSAGSISDHNPAWGSSGQRGVDFNRVLQVTAVTGHFAQVTAVKSHSADPGRAPRGGNSTFPSSALSHRGTFWVSPQAPTGQMITQWLRVLAELSHWHSLSFPGVPWGTPSTLTDFSLWR